MATEKQVAFIKSLVEERLDQLTSEEIAELLDNKIVVTMTSAEASGAIGRLLKIKPQARPQAVKEDGMYLTPDGTIYKVQFNKASGDGRRLYAKRLELENLGTDNDPKWKAHFVYEQGAVGRLREEMRMTLEQAKAFGALYGTCCRCGRTLTREESIDRAMGPVCAGAFM